MIELIPATLNDLSQIMIVEKDSFLPSIQEEESVFAKRIEFCPETFLVFKDNKKVIGYICAEYCSRIPSKAEELKLNHLPEKTSESSILYISSFAILSDFRGNGIGSELWNRSLACFKKTGSFSKILLLVNDEWKGARHIYEKSGFIQIDTFINFFPKINPSEKSDGILMELNL